ncbi:hypothetical protein ACEPT7_25725 [Burkholderia ubonensis]|uniref:hypothetical protein n=1 Tax=Burkholderia ubonensis TaxID=101571 RepID=UPI0012FC61AD|nr:hypothetical protein [Burkholderia ubonensis]
MAEEGEQGSGAASMGTERRLRPCKEKSRQAARGRDVPVEAPRFDGVWGIYFKSTGYGWIPQSGADAWYEPRPGCNRVRVDRCDPNAAADGQINDAVVASEWPVSEAQVSSQIAGCCSQKIGDDVIRHGAVAL